MLSSPWWRPPYSWVVFLLLLVLFRATLMPFNNLPWTDPLPCYQLIDLLKETGRWREGKVRPSMNIDVSERIQIVSHSLRETGALIARRFKRIGWLAERSKHFDGGKRSVEQEPHIVGCGALVCCVPSLIGHSLGEHLVLCDGPAFSRCICPCMLDLSWDGLFFVTDAKLFCALPSIDSSDHGTLLGNEFVNFHFEHLCQLDEDA